MNRYSEKLISYTGKEGCLIESEGLFKFYIGKSGSHNPNELIEEINEEFVVILHKGEGKTIFPLALFVLYEPMEK